MRNAVAASGCEVAFVYHWEALAATRTLDVPRVAGVGDPSHLPHLYRWREQLPSVAALKGSTQIQAAVRREPAMMVELLNECTAYGAFAAHHAEWLRQRGATRCRYLRTPVPDDPGTDWAQARKPRDPTQPARFLLLVHLKGIATTNGLRVFTRMLPVLDRALGGMGYVVDVVGGGEPPGDLRAAFEHPAIRRHGHTDDPGPWLGQTDALIVPTSLPLGIRVRIITGFSCGTPIVTHNANARGIPELEHESNALLGDTPEELALAAVRIARDADLQRRLAAGSRHTYETSFSPRVAAGAIVQMLREAAA
jgi:hypothetical protein